MYTIKELSSASKKFFGVSGALVAAALKETGKETFTLEEAKKIIEEFANREVKK